jgi:hypothetical protein
MECGTTGRNQEKAAAAMNRQQLGSRTAKSGFLNEHHICSKFLDYKNDADAKAWLEIMGYDPDKIQNIKVFHVPPKIPKDKALFLGISVEKFEESLRYKKADIQIRIEIEILYEDFLYIENISLKKSKEKSGFNQVDKRSVFRYSVMWKFDRDVENCLKLFTGEVCPQEMFPQEIVKKLRDKRRMFFDELPKYLVEKVQNFFSENKMLIVTDILRGRGGLSSEWFLVTKERKNSSPEWVLKDINTVCNFYAKGDVRISPRGSMIIGKITMQRKGGTPDPTSLQFKINPLETFKI